MGAGQAGRDLGNEGGRPAWPAGRSPRRRLQGLPAARAALRTVRRRRRRALALPDLRRRSRPRRRREGIERPDRRRDSSVGVGRQRYDRVQLLTPPASAPVAVASRRPACASTRSRSAGPPNRAPISSRMERTQKPRGSSRPTAGTPLRSFLCESLVRCETPASDFRLLWMRKRAGAFRPQLLLVVPSRRQLEVAGGLKGKALTKQEGHTGTHWQARRCVGADQLSRSDRTPRKQRRLHVG